MREPLPKTALPDAPERAMHPEVQDDRIPSPATAAAPDRRADPALLTVEQVAERLHMSTKSVRRRIKCGLIRKAAIGGRMVRISFDELRRLTAESAPGDASEDPDLSEY